MQSSASCEIAVAVVQELLEGVEAHNKTGQILRLMDLHAMRQAQSFLRESLGTFNVRPQSINKPLEEEEPPKPRIDSLATAEVRTQEVRSDLQGATDKDFKRAVSLKRKGSNMSSTQPHKFEKALEKVTGSVPLDL